MNVHTKKCWAARDSIYFRLTFKQRFTRLSVDAPDGDWTRSVATKALNLIETEIGVSRRNVRFVHE